jgi:hypothetical protein
MSLLKEVKRWRAEEEVMQYRQANLSIGIKEAFPKRRSVQDRLLFRRASKGK